MNETNVQKINVTSNQAATLVMTSFSPGSSVTGTSVAQVFCANGVASAVGSIAVKTSQGVDSTVTLTKESGAAGNNVACCG